MSRAYPESSVVRNYPIDNTALRAETYVHCPVCNTSYAHDQTETHIMRHALLSVNKNQENPEIKAQANSRTLLAYPMIEPLQFEVSRIVRPPKKEIVQMAKEQKNRRPARIIEMVDRETQTINRPLLQECSEERDLYNCFDNFFNGESFKYDDVMGKNVGLASKRNLTEWEEARLNK